MSNRGNSAELDALAHKIALSTVKADIESFCAPQRWSGRHYGTWYDPTLELGETEREIVDLAVRYAELKGLLERNPEQTSLVRIRVSL